MSNNFKNSQIFCGALLLLSMVLSVSCVSNKKYTSLEARTDSLEVINMAQGQQLYELQDYIETIARSLDSIAYQESILYLPDPETGRRTVSRSVMISRLESFQELIHRQKERVRTLEETILQDSIRLGSLHSLVSHLTTQIEQKDEEISKLKGELSRSKVEIAQKKKEIAILNESVDNLSSEVESLNGAVADLEGSNEELQNKIKESEKVYYIIGTRKELRDKGLLSTNSLKPRLDATNIQISDFASANPEDLSEYSFSGRSPKIITDMPKDSYILYDGRSGGQSKLEITDLERFWSVTKILVIVVN